MLLRTLCLIAVTILLTRVASAQDERLRLGIVTDLSGSGSYIGVQTRRGAKLALEDLRHEGIAIELLYEDHQSSPAKAASAAQKLISIDKARALYTNFSGPASAISPIAARAATVLVYSAAALSPMQGNPFAFKTYIDYRAGCRSAAEYFAGQRARVCLLKAESEFGEICERSLMEDNPQIAVEAYKSGETVETQVLKLRAGGCQAIINPSYELDVRNMLSAILRGRMPVMAAFTRDSLTSAVRQQYGTVLGQSVTFGLPEPDREFIARLKEADPNFDSGSSEFAAIAYLHVLQLGRASTHCGVLKGECLRETLLQAKPDPRFGFLGWSEDRVAHFSSGLREIDAPSVSY